MNGVKESNELRERYWFLTWTTFGSWLPGDERGFVGETRNAFRIKEMHNVPGTPCGSSIPALRSFARSKLRGAPVSLKLKQALALLSQFRETASIRNWRLLAVAIMRSHVHDVVGVAGDPDPNDLLRDFKSYGSRCLNKTWSKPASGTWWSESGSKRKLPDVRAVETATVYVKRQQNPLVVWTREDGLIHPCAGERPV